MADLREQPGPDEPGAHPRPAARDSAGSAHEDRLKVLLVEDNPMHRVLATGLLKERGYAVSFAGDGLEALSCFENEPFDLILMDIQMPRMNGLEAAERIRALESQRVRRVPIIALTSLSTPDDRVRSLAAGMDEHLTKPIDPPLLDETILRCLRLDPPDFEPERALERASGDPDLLTSIVHTFLAETPERLEAIHRAFDRRDAEALARSAETLEGAASRLAMPRLRDIAHRIAALSAQGDFQAAAALMDELEAAFDGSTTAILESLGSA